MASLKNRLSSFFKSTDFTLKEQLGFASGTFGNCMGQDCVETYTDQFFRDHLGLGTAQTLPLKSVTKAVNILSAPIIGALLDASKPGENRSNKFMFFSAIPLTAASVLLFTVPKGSLLFRTVWAFVLYLLFNVADTFFDISLMTISARMTTDTNARKTFYTIGQFASTLGSMLPGWILPVIVDIRKADEESAYFMVALTFGILGLITMLVPCFTLREKFIVQREIEKRVNIDFKMVFSNRPLILLSLSQLIDSVRQVCYAALPFMYKQTLGMFSMNSIVGACSGALSYMALASVPFVGKKLSSRDMVAYGYLWTGVCYILLALTGYKSKFLVGFLIAIAGMPNSAMGAARRILLADSVDYMEWKSYKKYGRSLRNEGMVFSFNTMIGRISSLWKDLMIDIGLSIIGYKRAEIDANGKSVEVEQTPKTLKGIFWLVVIPGIVGNLIPGIIMLFDDYTGKKKERILEELEEIRKKETEETEKEKVQAT